MHGMYTVDLSFYQGTNNLLKILRKIAGIVIQKTKILKTQ